MRKPTSSLPTLILARAAPPTPPWSASKPRSSPRNKHPLRPSPDIFLDRSFQGSPNSCCLRVSTPFPILHPIAVLSLACEQSIGRAHVDLVPSHVPHLSLPHRPRPFPRRRPLSRSGPSSTNSPNRLAPRLRRQTTPCSQRPPLACHRNSARRHL